MKKNPTDLEILKEIYKQYYTEYQAYTDENKTRNSKIYVPIDFEVIANILNTEVDIVFGRLYYHLNNKYSYKRDSGLDVNLFTLKAGDDLNCVNFPYLASILADLEDKNTKYLAATYIAVISLFIAICSILISTIK